MPKCPEEHGDGLGTGEDGLVLIRRRNSSLRCSMALVVPTDLHWAGSRRVKQKSRSPAASRLWARHSTSQEGLTGCLHLRGATGIDHVPVLAAQLPMEVLGSMGQQVAVLVNGAVRPWQAFTPEGGEGASRPGAPATITSWGRRRLRASSASRNCRQAPVLSPALLPT